MFQYQPQPAYSYYNVPPNMPPPWWPYSAPKGGKKGKRGSVKKQTLGDLLKEAIDTRDTLDSIVEKLAKKDKKEEPKKDDKKKPTFSTWDTMLLLTILALPCSLLQLGIAKAILYGLKILANN